ncbi:MAG: lasso peptide biosynthesis B2 protein [Blastocatellia bacterium]
MIHPLRFCRYAFAIENYLLLARAIRAARLVKKYLKTDAPSPAFPASVRAAEALHLPPQPGWRLSDPARIAHLASLLVRVPSEWGRCVQRSLIAYRLLNGYGYPARICFGVRKDSRGDDDLTRHGHAWIVKLDDPHRAYAEAADPDEKFKIVYSAPPP